MPYTLNGVGTTYYGKKKIEKKYGVCEKCNRNVMLESYETRLWFVVFFIPIIPLGKKRILNYCPSCTNHRYLSLSDWNNIKEKSIAQGIQTMQSNPGDAAAALKMHHTLVAFHETEEAQKLADVMAKNFPENIDVQMYLGTYYEICGQASEADTCFEKALKLDPKNVSARRAVGIGQIGKNDLAQAAKHLSFMMEPGENQDPSVLFMLANAYAGQGRHLEALDIYKIIIRDFPGLAHSDKKLRKAIAKTESALGQQQTLLPKKPFRFTQWMWGTLAAAGIVAAALALNWYLSNHQELLILNKIGAQSTVSIAGQPDIVLPKYAQKEITIPEGEYVASIRTAGRMAEQVRFRISNAWYDRLSSDKLFILNAGGAVLLHETTTYSEHADPNTSIPYRFFVGERFLTFRGIDYKFKEFPETIKIKNGEKIHKTRIALFDRDPAIMLNILRYEKVPLKNTLTYAETHLLAAPYHEKLLEAYVELCVSKNKVNQCYAFLEKGLAQRPISIMWHRMYQQIGIHSFKEDNKIKTLYQEMLTKEPQNSALLYLNGRIMQSAKEATTLYDQAIEKDAQNPFPLYAKAYQLAGCAHFNEAFPLCRSAATLRPKSEDFVEFLYELRFALKQYSLLDQELSDALAKKPLSWNYFQKLTSVKAASQNITGLKDAVKNFQSAVTKEMPNDPYQYNLFSSQREAYLLKDMDRFIKVTLTIKDPSIKNIYLRQAYLIKGEMQKAEQIQANYTGITDGYTALLFYLGWEKAGKAEKAEEWADKAKLYFETSSGDEKRIASLFHLKKGSVLEQLNDITIHPNNKRILYTYFALIAPKERQELLSTAKKLNYNLLFPYHLLNDTIKSIDKKLI